MKFLLPTAVLLVCSSGVGFAATPGLFGKITVKFTYTGVDESTYKESKTEDAHEKAIDDDKNSTRIETYGTKVQRVGNREILESMVAEELIPEIKGWAIGYVDAGYHGFVAFKKGAPAVAVPKGFLQLGESNGGYESGRFVSKYTASKNTLKETSTGSFVIFTKDFTLFDTALAGIQSVGSTLTETTRFPDGEGEPVETRSATYKLNANLSGGGEGFVVTGKLTSAAIKTLADVTPYHPEVEEIDD